jgi:hypothetical protein
VRNRIAVLSSIIGLLLGCEAVAEPAACDPAVRAARMTMHRGSHSTWTYQTARMSDGVAVLVSGNEAYFVRDGQVYAVNGSARAASPDIELVHTIGVSLDYLTVLAAIPNARRGTMDELVARNTGPMIPGTPDCRD